MGEEILRSQQRHSRAAAKQILEEGQAIQLQRFQVKGRTSWSRSLKTWCQGNIFLDDQVCPAQPAETTAKRKATLQISTLSPPSVVFFTCPACPTVADGTRGTFNLHSLDQKTWCKGCKLSRFVWRWRCECGLPWHACPTHSAEPDRLRASLLEKAPPPKRARHSSSSSRQVGQGREREQQLSNWLDAPTPKRARAGDAEIAFGQREINKVLDRGSSVNPRLLSANLRRRFSHLCTD